MLKKLRTILAASLLVSTLISNANAFTTDTDDALNPARPKSALCWVYWNGMWWVYDC